MQTCIQYGVGDSGQYPMYHNLLLRPQQTTRDGVGLMLGQHRRQWANISPGWARVCYQFIVDQLIFLYGQHPLQQGNVLSNITLN